MSDDTVLVTGGTGFLGAYCILRLLQAGYQVRTTVRDLRRSPDVREMLRNGGAGDAAAVEFVQADLTADDGWSAAVAGCAYVLHVASPYPAQVPRDENELIVPARDGTLRVLRAARDAGVQRVVLTSSFAAIGYGHARVDHVFTELDWTDPDGPGVGAYQRSKTLAERAAWDFVEREGKGVELAVVNPVGILGPLLGPPTTSVLLIQSLLNKEMPALPRLSFGIVDVRDVADLQLRAMTDPAAGGERFLATAGDSLWVSEIARILRDGLGAAGKRVPTRVLPDFAVRALALVSSSARPMVHDLGVFKPLSNDKARDVLGWRPRSAEDALIATGESLVKRGLLKHH
ncbi:SDR family oxidoreductase [Actinoallomurus soli]|uniref:SDR family oxidoreductase n=1 Tax=Actinoallomurus soli TaxID=2952535 RepID=UPI0020938864|nr:aldehyde reductase [Actinoallomurus soli]MCO5969997.1 aldehyde reductase [Actinoallomurus soli]